VEGIIKKI